MATETQAPAVPTVTVTIDEQQVVVPKGTLLIEAAKTIGIDIPYLCYYHKLTPFGGCRMCLVEVEKVPKLLAACNTPVADGMIVRTTTDKVKAHRKGTLEFILINHPLDCPVCDKGGECELQDRVFEHGQGGSRLTEPKVHIEDYDLGPLIVRNQDRCIICKRCVKVMEEIVGDPVLEFGQRGVTTEVYTFEHEPFPAGFSGNTVRVCPVGALMSKPFRFKARPWELIKTPSVCSLCSMGCNLREDVRENRLLRVVGLDNPAVNDGWLCDRGQFGYDYINSPDRLRTPLVKNTAGEFESASWADALKRVGDRLQQIKRQHGGAAIGGIGSEVTSNEDSFVFQKFMREVLETPNVDHRMGSRRSAYTALRPGPGAITALPKAGLVLLFASDLTAEVPVLDLVLKKGLLSGKMKLIVAHPRDISLNKHSSQWLQYRPGTELDLLNGLLKALLDGGLSAETLAERKGPEYDALVTSLAKFSVADAAASTGVPEAAIRKAAQSYASANLASIVFGRALADGPDGVSAMAALANLAVLTGQGAKANAVLLEAVEHCNTWGARDMGVLPETGPGYARVAKGLSTGEMLDAAVAGKLQVLYVMGNNVAVRYPDAAKARKALEAVEFLVVQDLFLTETARLADVVFPALTAAEKNATFTNVEGRVQRLVRAMDPFGASQTDWQILADLAAAMGESLGYGSADAVIADIRKGLTGSPQTQGPTPLGLTSAEMPSRTAADAKAPLRLYTGRLMFDHGTMAGFSTVLPTLAPEPFAEIHPDDARTHGIAAGDVVVVESSQGHLELEARVTTGTPAGTVFVPSGYNEAPVNTLLAGAATIGVKDSEGVMDIAAIIATLVKIIVVIGALMIAVPMLVWLERKLVADFQARIGPNRVGPYGLLQSFYDGIKLLMKEDIHPANVDLALYLAAPVVMMIPALTIFAVIPFGNKVTLFGHTTDLVIADLPVGVLYVLAISSLGVYGVVLSGWASNNKYSLMGGLRSSAQMVSYELPMGLAVVAAVMMSTSRAAGSLSLSRIVDAQSGWFYNWNFLWWLIPGFVAFIIYVICGIAETNRAPFDLPEAETELVAGYHTEYSSMKFAMFFLAEYANMLNVSAIATTLFLGGWRSPIPVDMPFIPDGSLLETLGPIFWFVAKILAFIFLYMWLRATLPRLRYDQLMHFAWKGLVPVALANIMVVATILTLFYGLPTPSDGEPPGPGPGAQRPAPAAGAAATAVAPTFRSASPGFRLALRTLGKQTNPLPKGQQK